MGDPSDGSEDVGELRTQLEEAQARIETLRRQQSEAKTKAKAVIQKQREQAKEQINILETENSRKAEELDAVKGLLRDAEVTKDQLGQEREALQTLVNNGKEDLQRILAELEESRKEHERLKKEKQILADNFETENKELRLRVKELEEKVAIEGQENGNQVADVNGSEAGQNAVVVREELKSAKERIAELEDKCRTLREEGDSLRKVSQENGAEGESKAAGDAVEQSSEELNNALTKADTLSKELSQARERVKRMEEERMEEAKLSQSKRAAVEKDLAESEKLVTQLRSDLQSAETSLQNEKEKVSAAEEKLSEAANSDASKTILEAKIAEMERVIASKQADIVRVREKAKTYLKDINAEKREMEENLKKEVDGIRKELEEEQEKVKLADQRTENVSTELDNCLTLIRDKQKTIQMLKMSLSTQQEASVTAQRERDSLRSEFAAYKERARRALQEKKADAAGSDEAVQSATQKLRAELEKAKKEGKQLRRQLSVVEDLKRELRELKDRAEKAEAAADLLRSNTSAAVSNMNYSQVDVLEEKVSKLEGEVRAAQTATDDAEAQHETTKMRLEAAERALRATEQRSEEATRSSRKIIEELNTRIATLETDLEKAQKASAAAHRTAAAAAKALSFEGMKESEGNGVSAMTISNSNIDTGENGDNDESEVGSPYATKTALISGHSTFAAAMEGHSESLRIANGQSLVSDEDLTARDSQIAVLTAQVAELGALLDEAQQETALKSEQTDLLKAEVKSLDAKLAAAEKLKNGAPFSYLRTIVVRYLETDDPTLLPVIANVLSFTEDETSRVKATRSSSAASKLSGTSSSGYFSLPFLGSR